MATLPNLQDQETHAVTGKELVNAAKSTESEAIDPSPQNQEKRKLKNAFSELMTPSKSSPQKKRLANPSSPKSRPDPTTGTDLNAFYGRDALGAYVSDPSAFPCPQRVILYSDEFVAIHDVYPKASIHILLLPRDEKLTLMHPFDAFADPIILASVRDEVAKLKKLAASELRRRFGCFSAADSARNAALDAEDAPAELPPGRNWESNIVAGIHAHPSMSHLHVHVMSDDHNSECLRHRKHYNSFSTPFFVPIDDFPLSEGDERRHPTREGYLDRELVCWRCGTSFGTKFKKLKDHLADEFEEWKKA